MSDEERESGQPFELVFHANPTQHRFINSRAEADLFSCRMGEGKSAALCWAAFQHARHNRHSKIAFIRDTWENCRDTTQAEFFKWFPPGVCGEYTASEKTFRWKLEDVVGQVVFMGMDDPKDGAKLQSRALSGFFMDEPAPAQHSGGIDEAIFDLAMTRLREPGFDHYPAKLATNNPDESHWTYKRFVNPGSPGFKVWQTLEPENLDNLRPGYYERLARTLSHRPDYVRRFVRGEYGFEKQGVSVTPEFNRSLHLATGLEPLSTVPLDLYWDFGLNPTAVFCQFTPRATLLVLECWVGGVNAGEEGEAMGVAELCDSVVKPALHARYHGAQLHHIGDPSGRSREQSSSEVTAVRMLKKELGGSWKSGPIRPRERIEPTRAALRIVRAGGRGMVQIDEERAQPLYHALRGGWHYPVSRGGIVGTKPVKNVHSHPGDAFSYGCAVRFPVGRPQPAKATGPPPRSPSFFGGGSARREPGGLRIGKEVRRIP